METKQAIFEKTESKNREIFDELYNYMYKENRELFDYMKSKNKLEDFLIYRTDAADREYQSTLHSDVPYAKETVRQILYCGIENSISEYVESMIGEVPKFYGAMQFAKNYDEILADLVQASVPIFYRFISFPYDNSQERLDKKLINLIRRKSKTYTIIQVQRTIIENTNSKPYPIQEEVIIDSSIEPIEYGRSKDLDDYPF